MSEQTAKHGPGMDEYIKHETQGMVQTKRPTRTEEWRDPEGLTAEDTEAMRVTRTEEPGSAGMSRDAVELRSEIARYLGLSAYPGDRERLLDVAAANNAPDAVLGRLRSLPDGEFENVQQVMVALGEDVEHDRSPSAAS